MLCISVAGTIRYYASVKSPGGHSSSLTCDWGTAGSIFGIHGLSAWTYVLTRQLQPVGTVGGDDDE